MSIFLGPFHVYCVLDVRMFLCLGIVMHELFSGLFHLWLLFPELSLPSSPAERDSFIGYSSTLPILEEQGEFGDLDN